MEYSQKILEYMETHGITGYRLAKETGISESLFGKWRKNPTSKIDALTLTKIADYFHISIETLIGKENIKNEFPRENIEKAIKIEKLFAEKGLPFDEKTVGFFLDFVAANAEIIKKQVDKNK